MEVEKGSLESNQSYQRRRASEAENEANARILTARKRVEDENKKANTEIEGIRTEFSKSEDFERSRTESVLQAQHDKSYENLMEQKRRLDTELSRMKHDSEKNITNTKTNFEIEKIELEKMHKKEMKELTQNQSSLKNYELKTSQELIEDLKHKQAREVEYLNASHNDKLEQLTTDGKNKLTELRQNYGKNIENAKNHYEENFNKIHEDQSKTLTQIGKAAKSQLDESRHNTSYRLNQYKTRQNDPFYKLVDLGIHLTEEKDQFRLVARIPEHEQKKIQVSVRGNELFLSGSRTNQEKMDVSPGHSRTTSSNQTFHETIPLSYPVNAKALTRRFEGELLIVEIPKLNRMDPNQIPLNGKVDKEDEVYGLRPNFPENIPGEKQLVAKIEEMKKKPEA